MAGHRSGRAARGKRADGPRPMTEWDRRGGESPEAWQAFLLYRDMRPEERSIRTLVERYKGGHPGVKGTALRRRMEKWSALFSWTFRADQWDGHLQRLRDEGIRQVFTQQIERYRILGDAALTASMRGLELVLKSLEGEKAEAPSFSAAISAAQAVVQLNQAVAAMAIERLERLQAQGSGVTGAREELMRRIEAMHAARDQAGRALEAAQAPSPEVQALQEADAGSPAPEPA